MADTKAKMDGTADRDWMQALGMSSIEQTTDAAAQKDIPNPNAENADLSGVRGAKTKDDTHKMMMMMMMTDHNSDTELEALAELVPDVKARRRSQTNDSGMSAAEHVHVAAEVVAVATADHDGSVEVVANNNNITNTADECVDDEDDQLGDMVDPVLDETQRRMYTTAESPSARRLSDNEPIVQADSMRVQKSKKDESNHVNAGQDSERDDYQAEDEASSQDDQIDDDSFDEFPGSDTALDAAKVDSDKVPKEFINMSSGHSVSTATQTQEVRMPMYLPTFKPATGCTNASDFIVRCFVARLRCGITVVKHGRSRWCKSRLRVLQIHADGRSLSWKPAEGEPMSSKRPPKLDLSTCLEVRHAWSPDPQNPMYTGTSILRQKCEAANAHKSFALIFKQRTVDITAVTADQCKVLMEGFSALCFRLQVANLAGRAGTKKGAARPMPEEDGLSSTASATLTNSSTPARAR